MLRLHKAKGNVLWIKAINEQTVNNLTTKLSSLPIWNDMKNNHQTPDGRNTEAALGEYPLDGYYYSISSTEATDARKNLILALKYTILAGFSWCHCGC